MLRCSSFWGLFFLSSFLPFLRVIWWALQCAEAKVTLLEIPHWDQIDCFSIETPFVTFKVHTLRILFIEKNFFEKSIDFSLGQILSINLEMWKLAISPKCFGILANFFSLKYLWYGSLNCTTFDHFSQLNKKFLFEVTFFSICPKMGYLIKSCKF